MSKKCELTGKIPMKGHNVSHANNKTKRRFLPNLKKVKFTSELMKRSLKLTVSNAGVRSVDKKGSFDEYLKVVKNKNLSPRLKKLKNKTWITAMVTQIKNQKWFRWHDAGDIQSMEHLEKIFEVCKQTPETMHWMPTREAQFLKTIDPATVPKNLIIRMSSHMVDQGPVKFWPWTSTVTSTGGASCPAPKQGGKCGDCRACWDSTVDEVIYPEH